MTATRTTSRAAGSPANGDRRMAALKWKFPEAATSRRWKTVKLEYFVLELSVFHMRNYTIFFGFTTLCEFILLSV